MTEDNITAADIVEPAAEEVYQEIDVFHYDVIDPENIEIDEEEIIGNLEETGILDAFIGSAYAFGVPNVEVMKELGGKDGYTLSVVIKDPTDERRQLQISFGIKDTVTVIVNDDIAMFDNTLTVTDSLEFSAVSYTHLYDPKSKRFLAQPGLSSELFYLNDEVVLQAAPMEARDILQIGETKLMFIPLCGPEFTWEDYIEKEKKDNEK